MSSAPPSQRFNQQKHLGVQGWSLSQSMNPKPVTSHLLVILVTSSVLPKNDSNAYICHCPSHSWQPCCRKKKVHKNFAAQQKRVLENLNRPLLLVHCFSVWKKVWTPLKAMSDVEKLKGTPDRRSSPRLSAIKAAAKRHHQQQQLGESGKGSEPPTFPFSLALMAHVVTISPILTSHRQKFLKNVVMISSSPCWRLSFSYSYAVDHWGMKSYDEAFFLGASK